MSKDYQEYDVIRMENTARGLEEKMMSRIRDNAPYDDIKTELENLKNEIHYAKEMLGL